MITWVVTGPIASGKSEVTRLLAENGAAVVDADRLGHQVLKQPEIINNLVGEFGSDILVDGAVDRGKLGALVFASASAMDRLNRLTHPPLLELIGQKLQLLEESGKHELAVLEAAVYFLWPPLERTHKVVAVLASDEVRRLRLQTQRDLKASAIDQRLASQESWKKFWARADVVIQNNGSRAELKTAVESLLLSQ